MLVLAALLSVLMGIALGLLGGGGSILTVPILIVALGLETKSAIATSLLVVGVTSLAGALQHARAGHVRLRTGALFGGFAMIGAYGGGRLSVYVPGFALLVLFAALMVGTSIAMLRSRPAPPSLASDPPRGARPLVAAEGLVAGVVTGLVGAGGGFLIVPALALLGGLGMREAVGTSLVVIALNSFSGFLGHVGHASVDYVLASVVSAAAIAGSVVGAWLSGRVRQAALRRGFAWFVLAMAVAVLVQELPRPLRAAVFVDFWPYWLMFAGIALIVLILRAVRRRSASSVAPPSPRDPVEPPEVDAGG